MLSIAKDKKYHIYLKPFLFFHNHERKGGCCEAMISREKRKEKRQQRRRWKTAGIEGMQTRHFTLDHIDAPAMKRNVISREWKRWHGEQFHYAGKPSFPRYYWHEQRRLEMAYTDDKRYYGFTSTRFPTDNRDRDVSLSRQEFSLPIRHFLYG